ncbi:MAG: ORF6N domain-containing protein [Bacteroidales bacterium]|nr:ORF6N domain-containing protein [Bacteroidales bacterium]HOY39175.1 ORF6N domain-containing protein [Bacteroidales bacterium]
MAQEKGKVEVYTDENIINRIYLVRGKKVMIDRELAELYGVETRVLNQAVRRNAKRFPEDFMFQMTPEELEEWKSQIVISSKEKMGLRKPPLVFTEQGVAMLSSVLNSDTAIMVNIQIIRIFTKMREMLETHKDILSKLDELERKGIERDEKIMLIFEYIKQFEEAKQQELEYRNRKPIGYKRNEEN